MLARFIGILMAVALIVLVVGSFFGYAIMIGVGVLHATYGFGTLSFGSSWALGLCWSALFTSAGAVKR